MKKLILLTTIIALFCSSCAKTTETELTAEQKATIEKEVLDQFKEYVSMRNQLDFDLWSKFWNSEDFIAAYTLYWGKKMSWSVWMDSVEVSFERRDRHHTEIIDLKATALTPDLALLTNVGVWENWWSGNYRKSNGCETQIWKRDQNGWRIIYVHESGKTIEEKLAD